MGSFRILLGFFAAVATLMAPSLTGQNIPLISANSLWRYDQSGANLGTAWRAPLYDDSAWPQGAGLLGLELGNPQFYPFPILTPLSVGGGRITYYFRAHFDFPTNPQGLFFVMTNYVDDGLVVYLNGLEAGRVRIPAGSVTSSTLAENATPEGRGVVLIFPATNVVQGDNVITVELHQTTVDSSDVVFGMTLFATPNPPTLPLPDLIIYGPAVNPRIETRVFSPGNCEVNEGCGIVGTRVLLRFDTETRNIGATDLVLGSPVGNPLFVYDSCHNHYHFFGFADYRLVDSNGNLAAVGNKVGFCLEDLTRFDPTAALNKAYFCDNQGIQRGWGDIYDSSLPCQYVDITGVPPGNYTLELEIDPDHKLAESNETNNITRVPVVVKAPCTGPPTNDAFTAAQVVSQRTVTAFGDSGCATRESGEPVNPVNNGGKSIWFRWTAPYTGTVTINTVGSNFDTILAFYRGASLGALTLMGSDDDNGGNFTSQLTANVVSGTLYQISVDGFHNNNQPALGGDVVLSVNPGANDLFANCIPITGVAGTVVGSTAGTGKEPLEPNHAGNSGGHSIWYCWTAPASGPFSFDTTGSRFDTLLAVYTGSSVSSLETVAANDNAGPGISSRVSFMAVGGTAYSIAIDGKAGATGICMLNWSLQPRLSAPVQTPNSFQFDLISIPGQACWIDTSSDAVAWSPWLRVTNATGSMPITDSPLLGSERRFYKARTD